MSKKKSDPLTKSKVVSVTELKTALPDCDCSCGLLDEWQISDKIMWTYRKLAALAELMDSYESAGHRGKFGGKRYAHLDYPDKMNGLGEILMGIAAELAWLHDKMENGKTRGSGEA